MGITKSFVKQAAHAYRGVAKVTLDEKHLVLREDRGDGVRPFIDGRTSIPLLNGERVKVREWLKEIYAKAH